MKTFCFILLLGVTLAAGETLRLKIHLPHKGADGELVYDLKGTQTESDLSYDFDYNGSLNDVKEWVKSNRLDGVTGDFEFMLMRTSGSFHIYKGSQYTDSLKGLELKQLIYPNARLTVLMLEKP